MLPAKDDIRVVAVVEPSVRDSLTDDDTTTDDDRTADLFRRVRQ
jgi:hypothetical protein